MLVVDKKTGTILDLDDCYIVDAEHLSEDTYSDSEVGEIAEKHGKSLAQICRDTGNGDNKYRWTVSYSPLSIRDEVDAWIEGGVYTEEDDEYPALLWAKDASEEDLSLVSDTIMANDGVWDDFRNNLLESLFWAYKSKGDK